MIYLHVIRNNHNTNVSNIYAQNAYKALQKYKRMRGLGLVIKPGAMKGEYCLYGGPQYKTLLYKCVRV